MEENEQLNNSAEGAVTNEKKGFAITSLVLGIVSVVLWCFWYISVPGGIVGLILGAASAKAKKNGMATAGIVLCIIALALTVAGLLGLAALIGAGGMASLQ